MYRSSNKRDSLRESAQQHLEGKKPKRLARPGILAVLRALVTGAAALGLSFGCSSPEDSSSSPQVKGGQWRFSIHELQEGKARHFYHKLPDNTAVRFFLIRLSEGIVRGALDACEVCWQQGKGYVQDGGYMVCKNCGRKFANEKIGIYRGGCNPHPLPYRIEGKELVIELRELEEGARYFRLTGGSMS